MMAELKEMFPKLPPEIQAVVFENLADAFEAVVNNMQQQTETLQAIVEEINKPKTVDLVRGKDGRVSGGTVKTA